MNKLIKTELKKVLTRRTLWVYIAIVATLFFCCTALENWAESYSNEVTETYYQSLEDGLSSYNLENAEDLQQYITDKNCIDKHKLIKNYNYTSPEYYYVYNTVYPLIEALNTAKYYTKDEAEIAETQLAYDNAVKVLDNFDWQFQIKEELKENKEILNNEELLKESGISKEIVQARIKALNYRLDNHIPYAYTDNSNEIDTYVTAADTYYAAKNTQMDEHYEKYQFSVAEKNFKELDYKIDNNELKEISNAQYSLKSIFDSPGDGSAIFISIAIILIASGMIADEFSKGTIKQLLLKPYSRIKIFISKMITCCITTLIFIIAYVIIEIVCQLMIGNSLAHLFDPIIIYNAYVDKVIEMNFIVYCLYELLLSLPFYLIILLITLMVSTLSTNTALANTCGFITLFGSILLPDLPYISDQQRSLIFLFTGNLNDFGFSKINNYQYMSLGRSLIVDVVAIIFFFVFTVIVFKKKDVKNQ